MVRWRDIVKTIREFQVLRDQGVTLQTTFVCIVKLIHEFNPSEYAH